MQRRERQWKNAFDLRGVDADRRGPVVLAEQLLGNHPAERMADQDRLGVHVVEQLAVVRGDLFDPEIGDGIGILARRLHRGGVTGPARSRRVIAALVEVLDPRIPGRGVQPQSMDEDDGHRRSTHTSP